MDTGFVSAITATAGFSERYVLLDEAPFFHVLGPLAAEDIHGALRLRRLFAARDRVLRVLYTVLEGTRSADDFARQVSRRFPVEPIDCPGWHVLSGCGTSGTATEYGRSSRFWRGSETRNMEYLGYRISGISGVGNIRYSRYRVSGIPDTGNAGTRNIEDRYHRRHRISIT